MNWNYQDAILHLVNSHAAKSKEHTSKILSSFKRFYFKQLTVAANLYKQVVDSKLVTESSTRHVCMHAHMHRQVKT